MRRAGRPKGTKQSPEAIEKIRQAMIAQWRDPAYRARQLPILLAAQPLAAKVWKEMDRGIPHQGTDARRQYNKVRSILGPEAARSLQW